MLAHLRDRYLNPSFLINLLFIPLVPLAVFSLYRGAANATDQQRFHDASNDFHSYWTPGHALLKSSDPYAATLNDNLDAFRNRARHPEETGLATTPANAPLMLLFITPLSLLSWPAARSVWMALNVLLTLSIPFLTIALSPTKINNRDKALIALTFYGMNATRSTISLGQTSLLVLTATLAAVLLASHHPWVAGLLFGLALSKYTLVLPVILWFVAFRHYRVALTAIAVQAAGIVITALIARTSPILLVENYVDVVTIVTEYIGALSINGVLTRLSAVAPVKVAALLIWGLITLAILVVWQRRYSVTQRSIVQDFSELLLLTILLISALQAVYHRSYDAVTLIVFLVLIASVMYFLKDAENSRMLALTWMATFGVFVVLFLPLHTILRLRPNWYNTLSILQGTATMVAWLLTLTIILLNWDIGTSSGGDAHTEFLPG